MSGASCLRARAHTRYLTVLLNVPGGFGLSLVQAAETIADLETQITQYKQALQEAEFQRQKHVRVSISPQSCPHY